MNRVRNVLFSPLLFLVTKDTLDKYHALLNLSSSSNTLTGQSFYTIFFVPLHYSLANLVE